jgi:hypothetical protein
VADAPQLKAQNARRFRLLLITAIAVKKYDKFEMQREA